MGFSHLWQISTLLNALRCAKNGLNIDGYEANNLSHTYVPVTLGETATYIPIRTSQHESL